MRTGRGRTRIYVIPANNFKAWTLRRHRLSMLLASHLISLASYIIVSSSFFFFSASDSTRYFTSSMGLNAEDYTTAPANLSLEQVHVYVRHGGYYTSFGAGVGLIWRRRIGERTPVGIRMQNAPASIPEHWIMCKTGRQHAVSVWDQPSASLGKESPATLEVKRIMERRDGTSTPGEWSVTHASSSYPMYTLRVVL